MPHLQLQGPKSRELLASLTDADIDSLRYFRFLEDVTIGGVPGCLVSRTGYSGELGYEIYTVARERRAALERAARRRASRWASAPTASPRWSRCASSRA